MPFDLPADCRPEHSSNITQVEDAERLFARIRRFGDRALADLPDHGTLIRQINAAPRGGA